jgi:alanyl-tRNA synthetase
MFVNAGMVPFKNVFTGLETRPYTPRASTRRSACAPAASTTISTTSATPRATTPSSRCSATSRSATISRNRRSSWPGPADQGIRPARTAAGHRLRTTDDEAHGLWKKIAGLPDERIIRIATSDNFWAMGDTGPCGPARRSSSTTATTSPAARPGSPTRTATASSRSGTWSSCSSSRSPDGTRRDLPRPSIDTGMGLERIAAVLQGKHDNYDTDLPRADRGLGRASGHARRRAPARTG